MEYNRTQYGTLINILLGIVAVVLVLTVVLFPGSQSMPRFVGLILIGIFVFAQLCFYKFNVRIDQEGIRIRYGIGLIRFTIAPERVVSAITVKNPWYYGLGIRFTPRGMLYNICGNIAVELEFVKKGRQKRIRIGTDDPEAFITALNHYYPF